MKQSLPVSIDLNRTSEEFRKHLKRMSEQKNKAIHSNLAVDYSLKRGDEVQTLNSLINHTTQRVIEINNMAEIDGKTKQGVKLIQPFRDSNQERPIALASSSRSKQIYIEPYCDKDNDIKTRDESPKPATPKRIKYSDPNFINNVNKETQTDNILKGNESINEIKNFLHANGMSRNAMQSIFVVDNNNNHNNENNPQDEQDLYSRSNRISEELRQEIIIKSNENKKTLLINNAALIALAQKHSNLNINNYNSDQKCVTPNELSVNTEVNTEVATNVNMSPMLVSEKFDSAGGFKSQKHIFSTNRDQSRMGDPQLKLHRQQQYQSHHENLVPRHYMPRTSQDHTTIAPRASQNMQHAMHYADNDYRKMRVVYADHSSTAQTIAVVPEVIQTDKPNYTTRGFLYPSLPPWYSVGRRQIHHYLDEQEDTRLIDQDHGDAQDQLHQQDLMYKQMKEQWRYQNRYSK